MATLSKAKHSRRQEGGRSEVCRHIPNAENLVEGRSHRDHVCEWEQDVALVREVVLGIISGRQLLEPRSLPGLTDSMLGHRHPLVHRDHHGVEQQAQQDEDESSQAPVHRGDEEKDGEGRQQCSDGNEPSDRALKRRNREDLENERSQRQGPQPDPDGGDASEASAEAPSQEQADPQDGRQEEHAAIIGDCSRCSGCIQHEATFVAPFLSVA